MPTTFGIPGFSITDNLTDIRIYEGLLRGGRSVTEAAMRTDYARYWHGYAVVLRPLMIVLSIVNIRYLNMMGLMALFLVCGWKCRERFGWRTAAHFCGGLLMSFLLIAPFCQQYMSVSFLALAAAPPCCADGRPFAAVCTSFSFFWGRWCAFLIS